ncbi:glycoside hydrolase family 28 protein [Novosphingobium aerophilum]|uniref:rhamnogalacturonidase n=1 Tax=Novosphingobium aerophilum TaxID=2839843 RepID=UPI003FD55857
MDLPRRMFSGLCMAGALTPLMPRAALGAEGRFDVRHFGAKGDGTAIDSPAFNAAIAEAARRGGTVLVPAGRYLCFSIRLQSRIRIVFEQGATIVAADPALHGGSYDLPEPAPGLYQDFGHSHWRNSLIWGEDIEDMAIEGPGLIHGLGLTRDGPGARWKAQTGERPLSMQGMSERDIADLEPAVAAMQGLGNKAIALKRGRNIRLSGFTVLKGGHFAILATGTSALLIESLTIDTDRDGIDLDCVKDTLVRGCKVNSPNDDGIVVKSSLALSEPLPAENVLIRDCAVSGYDMGTMLDGTHGTAQHIAPDRDRVTGRIKLGTESNGGYRNVVVQDCTFTRCRGLALETVDGGVMENVVASRLTMRDVTTAPLFVRLGDRRRGPDGTGVGAVRRVVISEIDARGIDPRFPATFAGLAGHPIESIEMRDIHLVYGEAGKRRDSAPAPVRQVPELAGAYPEPSMFGVLPAWALWVRHVERLTVDKFHAETILKDVRAPIRLENVAFPRFSNTLLRQNGD